MSKVMSLPRCLTRVVLLLVALVALSGLGAGVQSASAASRLDHGGVALASCAGSCSVASQMPVRSVSRAASPILAWCCMSNPSFNPFFSFNQFSPFFSFRSFNPFMRFNTFFPFFRPFANFFPFFRLFSSSRTVSCIQIMTMPTGQTITIRVC